MARSSKKGPYIHPKLLKKVNQMKNSGDRKMIKTWSRASEIARTSSVLRSQFIMVESLYRCMLPKTWSDISSVSSHQLALLKVMPEQRAKKRQRLNKEGLYYGIQSQTPVCKNFSF